MVALPTAAEDELLAMELDEDELLFTELEELLLEDAIELLKELLFDELDRLLDDDEELTATELELLFEELTKLLLEEDELLATELDELEERVLLATELLFELDELEAIELDKLLLDDELLAAELEEGELLFTELEELLAEETTELDELLLEDNELLLDELELLLTVPLKLLLDPPVQDDGGAYLIQYSYFIVEYGQSGNSLPCGHTSGILLTELALYVAELLDELAKLLKDDELGATLLDTEELLAIELLFDELDRLLLEETTDELLGVGVGDGVEPPPPPPHADRTTVSAHSMKRLRWILFIVIPWKLIIVEFVRDSCVKNKVRALNIMTSGDGEGCTAHKAKKWQ